MEGEGDLVADTRVEGRLALPVLETAQAAAAIVRAEDGTLEGRQGWHFDVGYPEGQTGAPVVHKCGLRSSHAERLPNCAAGVILDNAHGLGHPGQQKSGLPRILKWTVDNFHVDSRESTGMEVSSCVLQPLHSA